MSGIELGFPEERDSLWLVNRYFSSKLGGKPAWLDLKNLPATKIFKCKTCQSPISFLCQIYAPYEGENTFHRYIYVFLCRKLECQQSNISSNFLVLRSQLPLQNEFFSDEPPDENGDPLPAVATKQKLCFACGFPGPFDCSKCKKASYCSEQHQRMHWLHHKKICSKSNSSQPVILPQIEFPEMEIVMEDKSESAPTKKDDEDDEKARILEYERLKADGKTGSLQEVPDTELDKYSQMLDGADDKDFRKFKAEVDKESEQIVRYHRNGKPLWIADITKTVAEQLPPPNCELCGGLRQFEFQIMPQMLLHLQDENLDWGVLAVYTCAISCQPPSDTGYVKEYIIKQDIIK